MCSNAVMDPTPVSPVLESITIVSLPTKIEYLVGENLDTSGLAVSAVYSNGVSSTITDGLTYSGYDKSVLGQQTVTVSYSGKTAFFVVNIKQVQKTITGISAVDYPATRLKGQEIYLSIDVSYSDGTSSTVTSGFTVSGYDKDTAGDQTVTVTYETFTISFSIEVQDILVTGVSIKTPPTKTSYFQGELLDTSGLVLLVTLSDDTVENVTTGFTTDTTELQTTGPRTVIVTYVDKTTSFQVTVNSVTITSISVIDPPVSVFKGQDLSLTVKANYNDGSSQDKTSGFTVSGYDKNTTGDQTVTVTYETFTDTFTVSVQNISVTGVSIKTPPTKTSYFQGELLDTSGLVLLVTLSNDTVENVTTGFTTDTTELQTAGPRTVIVTYVDKTTSFQVDVIPVTITGMR